MRINARTNVVTVPGQIRAPSVSLTPGYYMLCKDSVRQVTMCMLVFSLLCFTIFDAGGGANMRCPDKCGHSARTNAMTIGLTHIRSLYVV